MIFVTVGTHNQPFDRLLRCIDELAATKEVHEDVFMQTGTNAYIPKHCAYKTLLTPKEMKQKMEDAHIVITHGGPSSFVQSLELGKVPVVVARRKEFHEHINNHQVDFCKTFSQTEHSIIYVDQISQLEYVLEHYDDIAASMRPTLTSNNKFFNEQFTRMVEQLFQS
jgi:UDP-N-acetylglucosamine transferase subunit ALG13